MSGSPEVKHTKKNSIVKKKSIKVKRKPKKENRLHIIFDIDSTLIDNYDIDNKEIFDVTATKNVQYKLLKRKEEFGLTFLRYYYDFIMKYCLEHFDVSIWSAGPIDYVESVMKQIYSEDIYNQMKCVIGRTDYKEGESIVYKDIKNNISFKQVAYNWWYTKKMDYLFKHKFYSKMFNEKNSLLIDDSGFVVTQNQFNSMQIPKFCVKNADNDLFKLYLWLEKNKNTKDIRMVDKDIFYIHGKMLCAKEVSKVFKIDKLSDIKTVKKKQYEVGEEVYFNVDKKVEIEKSEKLSFGIIKNITKNKYDILYPGDLENEYKNYKNITVENIRKYTY